MIFVWTFEGVMSAIGLVLALLYLLLIFQPWRKP